MTDHSIEFQPLPPELSASVRRSFRIPVSSKDNILAIFEGITYAVANLSADGITIHAESCLTFKAGQILKDAELWIGTQRLRGLTGRVVHCSVHSSGSLQFGMAWQDLAPDHQAVLDEFLARIRTFVLKSE